MDQTEQQYIDGLFDRLQGAERQGYPRDAGAERYIQSRIAQQPGAPYYMAQAIIMQEEGLKAAQARIEELERELEERPAQQSGGGGGFLGGLFGGGGAQPARGTSVPSSGSVPRAGGGGFNYPGNNNPGYGRPGMQPDPTLQNYGQQGRGGGFLAGAAQTAMGVAGGMMLGSMLGGMFGGGDTAKAAEAGKGEEAAKAEEPKAEQQAGAEQANDPFANVQNTQYGEDDSVLGGDFGDGDYDI